jgi:hypothetical protein
MQSLFRNRMSALQDSATKSRYAEMPFEKWTLKFPADFFKCADNDIVNCYDYIVSVIDGNEYGALLE